MFKRFLKYILVIVLFIFIGKVDAKNISIDEFVEEYNSYDGLLRASKTTVGSDQYIVISGSDVTIEENYSSMYELANLESSNDIIMIFEYDDEEKSLSFGKVTTSGHDDDFENLEMKISEEYVVVNNITNVIFYLSGKIGYELKDGDYSETFDDYGYQFIEEKIEELDINEIMSYKISLNTDKIAALIDEYGELYCLRMIGGGHYNIKFNVNGGEEIENAKVCSTCGDIFEYELPIPKKEGYAFIGWYSDKELTNKVEKLYDIDFEAVRDGRGCETGELRANLYAKWKKEEVSVDNTSKKSSLIIISIVTIIFGLFIVNYIRKKSLN